MSVTRTAMESKQPVMFRYHASTKKDWLDLRFFTMMWVTWRMVILSIKEYFSSQKHQPLRIRWDWNSQWQDGLEQWGGDPARDMMDSNCEWQDWLEQWMDRWTWTASDKIDWNSWRQKNDEIDRDSEWQDWRCQDWQEQWMARYTGTASDKMD